MTTVIEIDDKGIFCYAKPLHIYSDSPDEKTSQMYQRALAEAKDDKIYFRDQLATAIKLIGYKGMLEIEFDKEYPVPDGYEVKIEEGTTEMLISAVGIEYEPYAILVPKEKVTPCPKCRTTDFASCHSMYCPMRPSQLAEALNTKQPSIEEAAEQHIKDFEVFLVTRSEIDERKAGFIAGAKWMAQQFKQEKL